MIPVEQIACYILAGGQSKRMGRDKGLLPIGHETFVGRIRAQALSVLREVYVISGNPAYDIYTPCVTDLIPDRGPLGGLFTALHQHPNKHILLLSCDMPLIDAALLHEFLKHGQTGQLCLVRSGDRVHPFPGLYPPQTLPIAERMLNEKQLKIMALQQFIEPVLVDLHPLERQLKNINTPEQYQELNDRL